MTPNSVADVMLSTKLALQLGSHWNMKVAASRFLNYTTEWVIMFVTMECNDVDETTNA